MEIVKISTPHGNVYVLPDGEKCQDNNGDPRWNRFKDLIEIHGSVDFVESAEQAALRAVIG